MFPKFLYKVTDNNGNFFVKSKENLRYKIVVKLGSVF